MKYDKLVGLKGVLHDIFDQVNEAHVEGGLDTGRKGEKAFKCSP